jgi:hypothetical protein
LEGFVCGKKLGLRANGEAEIGFTQVSEVLPYTGAEVRGPAA